MEDFTKKYWEDLIERDIPNRLVINGVHYVHNGMSKSKYRGMGGSEYTIKLNGGAIVKTNDLWHQGDIPQEFRDELPDNAEFVKEL